MNMHETVLNLVSTRLSVPAKNLDISNLTFDVSTETDYSYNGASSSLVLDVCGPVTITADSEENKDEFVLITLPATEGYKFIETNLLELFRLQNAAK